MFVFRPSLGIAAPLAAAAILFISSPADRAAIDRLPTAATAVDTALLHSYRWRNIGPDRGGRSIAVSGVRGRKQEAYFGAVGGGQLSISAT